MFTWNQVNDILVGLGIPIYEIVLILEFLFNGKDIDGDITLFDQDEIISAILEDKSRVIEINNKENNFYWRLLTVMRTKNE